MTAQSTDALQTSGFGSLDLGSLDGRPMPKVARLYGFVIQKTRARMICRRQRTRRLRNLTPHPARLEPRSDPNLRARLERAKEILAIRALLQALGFAADVVSGHESEEVGDLLGTGDLQALAQLDLLDEVRGAEERLLGTSIEPGVAAAELFDVQGPLLQIATIEIGDLELPSGRWFQRLGESDDARVVEVESRHGEVRLRLLRLLLDADGPAVVVELDHAVALGIVNPVGEHGGAVGPRAGATECVGQAVSVEDVVAEDQTARIGSDEVATDEEGLGQAA